MSAGTRRDEHACRTAFPGSARIHDIHVAAGDRLEPTLRNTLDTAGKDPASPDSVASFACLYAGYDYRDRAALSQEPWSRL